MLEGVIKFVPIGELRGRTSQLRSGLEREKELVVTSRGKPIAILSATDEHSFERTLRDLRRCRANEALSRLQRDASRRGLDALTMEDVDAEIRDHRRRRDAN